MFKSLLACGAFHYDYLLTPVILNPAVQTCQAFPVFLANIPCYGKHLLLSIGIIVRQSPYFLVNILDKINANSKFCLSEWQKHFIKRHRRHLFVKEINFWVCLAIFRNKQYFTLHAIFVSWNFRLCLFLRISQLVVISCFLRKFLQFFFAVVSLALQCLSTRFPWNLGGFSFNCECENTTKFVVVRLEMRLELKFCGSADEVKYFVSKHYQSIYFFSAFTVLLHIVLLEYCTNCRNHCTSLHGLNPQWLYFPIGRTSPPNVMLWFRSCYIFLDHSTWPSDFISFFRLWKALTKFQPSARKVSIRT